MTSLRYPWEHLPDQPVGTRGRRVGVAGEPRWLTPTVAVRLGQAGAVAPSPATVIDWLYHHLTVQGVTARVSAFAVAAVGAGVVPWRVDFAALEEDLFHRLLRSCDRNRLSLEGCRAFAGQFREKVEARHARAEALVGGSRACPFDLHALLPVPDPVLALGVDDPRARRWLLEHWGTLELRQAVLRPARPGRRYLPPGHQSLRLGFFSADWSPWAALRQLRIAWPDLRLELRPIYTRD